MATKRRTANSKKQPELELDLDSNGNIVIDGKDVEAVEGEDESSAGSKRQRSHVRVHKLAKRQSSLRKTFPLIDNLAESPQSNVEQKLINLVLRIVQQTRPNQSNEYRVSFADVCTALGIDTRNREYITQAASTLQSIRMSFNAFEKLDNGIEVIDDRRAFIVLVPTIIYENGQFIFKINEDIRPYMDDKLQYVMIHESETSKLKLVGSVRLFEIASKYLHIGMSEKMEWEELRNRMLSKDNAPAKALIWSKFYDRFLMPSILEINNQTELQITLHKFNSGSRVKYLKLEVRRVKPAAQITTLSAAHSQLMALMSEFKFTRSEITQIFEKYAVSDIQKAYAYTRYKIINTTTHKIKKPDRYMIRTLESAYYDELPNAAELLGIVWVDQLTVKASSTNLPLDLSTDSERIPNQSELLSYIVNKRSIAAKEILEQMPVEERQSHQAKYNEEAPEYAKLNIGSRSKVASLSMFTNWFAKNKFGEVSEAEMDEAIQDLTATDAGKEYLKKMRA